MNITMSKNETELTVALEGRLDTLTAPELEEQLEPALDEFVDEAAQFDDLTMLGITLM